MNILDTLKKERESVSIYYYGKDDMASGFQVKTLIDKYKTIKAYYDDNDFNVDTLDDYIDYIFVDIFSKLEELEPIINPSIIEDFKNSIEYIKNIRKQYTREKIKDLEPIMYVKNKDFIPVTGWFGMSCDDGQLIVQEQYQKIFENRYLKYKCKYILWNDVVEKVRFFGAVPHPTIDRDYDGYDQVYTIVQE